MQAIGADHEIDMPRSGMVKGDMDRRVILFDRRDRVTEDRLNPTFKRAVVFACQIAAKNAEITSVRRRRSGRDRR